MAPHREAVYVDALNDLADYLAITRNVELEPRPQCRKPMKSIAGTNRRVPPRRGLPGLLGAARLLRGVEADPLGFQLNFDAGRIAAVGTVPGGARSARAGLRAGDRLDRASAGIPSTAVSDWMARPKRTSRLAGPYAAVRRT